jgi:SsrA-binding protein
MQILVNNKKAFFDYEILKEYEAGIVLEGHEVKSIKQTQVSLKESYISAYKNELWIYGMHVNVWKHATDCDNINPIRQRKLLLKRREINHLMGQEKIKGLTIVPLDIHLLKGRIKLRIALARGKKLYDKREKIKQKEREKDIRGELKKMGY